MQSDFRVDPMRVIGRLTEQLTDALSEGARYAAACDQLVEEKAELARLNEELTAQIARNTGQLPEVPTPLD